MKMIEVMSQQLPLHPNVIVTMLSNVTQTFWVLHVLDPNALRHEESLHYQK